MSVLAMSVAVTSAAGSRAADRRPAEAARSIQAAEARRRPADRRQPVDRPPQRRRAHRQQRRRQRAPSRDRPSSSHRASRDRRASLDRRANRDRHRASRDRRPNRRRSGCRSASRSLTRAHRTAAPPRRNSWRSLHLQPASPRPQEVVRVSSSGVPPLLRPRNGITEALRLRRSRSPVRPILGNTVAKFHGSVSVASAACATRTCSGIMRGKAPTPGKSGVGASARAGLPGKDRHGAQSKQNVCQVCQQLCAMDGVFAGVERMFTGEHGER